MTIPLEFIPYEGAYTDFLITTQDNQGFRSKLTALGARRTQRLGHVVYHWVNPLPDMLLIGLGVLDGRLLIGPKKLSHEPSQLGAGAYAILSTQDEHSSVMADPFGMHVIYAGPTLVTNRLHLAALLTNGLDVGSALATTYANHMFTYQFSTLETPIRGVRMLLAGERVIVDNQVTISTNAEEEHHALSPDEYWRLIHAGAEEIVANTQAILDSSLNVVCDISGGRDSRLLFAAVAALGRIEDVGFNTHANDPSRVRDLEIATGLVHLFGGSYLDPAPVVGYACQDPQKALLRRRSQLFGAYHYIISSELNPVISLSRGTTIRMMGGCGELYRDYYQGFFTSVDPRATATPEILRSMFTTHAGLPYGPAFLEDYYLPYLQSTFKQLPGRSIGHKLDAHYLNFRNRYHFGVRQTAPTSVLTINPALSPSLLKAARGLPHAEKASGRVLFDATKILHAPLAYYPYDKDSPYNLARSEYHIPSRYDDAALTLDPKVDLATPQARPRNPAAPERPRGWQKVDFRDFLIELLDHAELRLGRNDSPFPDLFTSELKADIQYSLAKRESRLSAWASRMTAFSDYVQICSDSQSGRAL